MAVIDAGGASAPSKLLICGPAYSATLHVRHVASLVESIAHLNANGVDVQVHWLTDCAVITRARQELMAAFMAGDCTHMLSIDSDVAWDPTAPWRLMQHNVPFVSATTFTRGSKKMCIRGADWDRPEFDYDPVRKLLRVGAVGSAFCMFRRDAVEMLQRAYPELKIRDDRIASRLNEHLYAFYHQILHPTGYLDGEDYSLAERFRAAGGEVFVDPFIELTHFGREEMHGKLADVMTLDVERREAA